MSKAFDIVALTLTEANEFVDLHHRHHVALRVQLFSLGLVWRASRQLLGAAIVARPVSTYMDDGFSVEVARLTTDGTPNASSALLGAVARAAWSLGRKRLITYIRHDEPGTSLQAAGWVKTNDCAAKSWSTSDRDRTDKTEVVPRKRYELLHPDLVAGDEHRWFDLVVEMAERSERMGVSRSACPFQGAHYEQRRIWLEAYDAAKMAA